MTKPGGLEVFYYYDRVTAPEMVSQASKTRLQDPGYLWAKEIKVYDLSVLDLQPALVFATVFYRSGLWKRKESTIKILEHFDDQSIE
jgi:hypothetical protein